MRDQAVLKVLWAQVKSGLCELTQEMWSWQISNKRKLSQQWNSMLPITSPGRYLASAFYTPSGPDTRAAPQKASYSNQTKTNGELRQNATVRIQVVSAAWVTCKQFCKQRQQQNFKWGPETPRGSPGRAGPAQWM